MQLRTLPLALAAAAALSLSACNSGSRSRSSTGTAPTGTAAITSLPTPGGGVAALDSAATPQVQTTVQLGAHQAFQESVSISDLVIPDVPGLRSKAFVVEDNGTLRILDLSGPAPALDRAIAVYGAALPGGTATSSLTVQAADLALLISSGAGAERVALFDPLNATASNQVTVHGFDSLTFTWSAGTLNDKGVDVSGQALPLSYLSGAAVAGGKLLFTSSNFDSNFDLNPGTLTHFDYDPATRQLSGGGAFLKTSDFNPTGLTRLVTPQGELVVVTNTGPFGGGGASLDLIDPVSFRFVGTIELPNSASPVGRVRVSPDGLRGYVAAQASAEVYVIEMEDVGLELGNATAADLDARYLGAYALPSTAATNFVSSIALSHTGNYLYAASFNESKLYVVDLTTPGLGGAVTGFQRSADPSNFEGLLNTLAVRPGVPGTDFQGPSLYAMTINLAAADQTIQNVRVALDTITLDRH